MVALDVRPKDEAEINSEATEPVDMAMEESNVTNNGGARIPPGLIRCRFQACAITLSTGRIQSKLRARQPRGTDLRRVCATLSANPY